MPPLTPITPPPVRSPAILPRDRGGMPPVNPMSGKTVAQPPLGPLIHRPKRAMAPSRPTIHLPSRPVYCPRVHSQR
jgi:hypothetical protein